MIGTIIYWAVGVTIIVSIIGIAYSYLPDDFKKWIKKKLFKEAKK